MKQMTKERSASFLAGQVFAPSPISHANFDPPHEVCQGPCSSGLGFGLEGSDSVPPDFGSSSVRPPPSQVHRYISWWCRNLPVKWGGGGSELMRSRNEVGQSLKVTAQLRRGNIAKSERPFVSISVGTPLYPYGIACRRVYALSTCGLFKTYL